MTAIEKIGQIIKKYWPIKNYSQTLSDAKVAAFERESADSFFLQLGEVHKVIIAKPETVIETDAHANGR